MTGPTPAHRLYAPEYGSVGAVVGYGLFVLIVARATDALRDTLRTVAPDVPADVLGVSMAATLWVVLGAVVLAEARRQTADNPHEFLAAEVALAFLADRRPTRGRVLLALGLAAGGAGTAWLGHERFLATLDGAFQVLSRVAETGSPGPFALANLAWGAAFVLGVLAFGWGADRLLVGLLREGQYRRYRRRVG